MSTTVCDECGKEYELGEWPYCPHGLPLGLQTFKPYIDYHMLDHPVEITSWKERKNLERIHGLVEKEPPSNSKLAERRDRVQWQAEVKQRAIREAQ